MSNSDYSDHFREHVIPVLRRMIRSRANTIARGYAGFTECEIELRDHARRHGAGRLSAWDQTKLDDWIDANLERQVTIVEARMTANREAADTAMRGIGHWIDIIVARASEPTHESVLASLHGR
jgi:antibiotic biosynthesis monooxygenase (ABM) superfamily enzyme